MDNKYTPELKYIKEYLEKNYNYTVGYIALQGSQNYGLDINTPEYQSDIDMKAIIIPDLDMLLDTNKPLSTTIDINKRITKGGYLIEKVEVKDIRHYFHIMAKGNPSYLEPMFSDYYLIDDNFTNDFEHIRKYMEGYTYEVRDKMIRAIYGMAKQKQHALTKEYPSKVHLIEEYGYDSKQVMHVFRLYTFARDYYLLNESFRDSLIPRNNPITRDKDYLFEIKKYRFNLQSAKTICDNYVNLLEEIRDKFKNIPDNSDRYINSFKLNVNDIIKKSIKKELSQTF